jgi:chromosome segregation ATPase
MEQIVIGLAERYGPGVAVMMVSMFIALTMTRIFSRKVDAQSNLSDAEANTQTTISSLALSNQKHVTDLQAQLITNLSQQIAQQRDLSELRGEFNTYRATAELRIQGATDQVIKTEAYNKRLSDSNDKLREEVAASSKQKSYVSARKGTGREPITARIKRIPGDGT